MNALADCYDDLDVEDRFRRTDGRKPSREQTSKSQMTTRARYSRRKKAKSFNGVHCRKNKRNCL